MVCAIVVTMKRYWAGNFIIIKTNRMTNEHITINKLELASELAHEKLVENWSGTIQIFENDTADETNYTDEAQDIFNEYYDNYLELIESTKA